MRTQINGCFFPDDLVCVFSHSLDFFYAKWECEIGQTFGCWCRLSSHNTFAFTLCVSLSREAVSTTAGRTHIELHVTGVCSVEDIYAFVCRVRKVLRVCVRVCLCCMWRERERSTQDSSTSKCVDKSHWLIGKFTLSVLAKRAKWFCHFELLLSLFFFSPNALSAATCTIYKCVYSIRMRCDRIDCARFGHSLSLSLPKDGMKIVFNWITRPSVRNWKIYFHISISCSYGARFHFTLRID